MEEDKERGVHIIGKLPIVDHIDANVEVFGDPEWYHVLNELALAKNPIIIVGPSRIGKSRWAEVMRAALMEAHLQNGENLIVVDSIPKASIEELALKINEVHRDILFTPDLKSVDLAHYNHVNPAIRNNNFKKNFPNRLNRSKPKRK